VKVRAPTSSQTLPIPPDVASSPAVYAYIPTYDGQCGTKSDTSSYMCHGNDGGELLLPARSRLTTSLMSFSSPCSFPQ